MLLKQDGPTECYISTRTYFSEPRLKSRAGQKRSRFSKPAIRDDELAAMIHRLHVTLEWSEASHPCLNRNPVFSGCSLNW